MNNKLKNIISEISTHANTGRLWFEAEEDEKDPLAAGGEEETSAEEDPLAGGDEDPLGDMGDDLGGLGDMGDESADDTSDAEDAKLEAEREKAEAQADAAEAEADAAKAEAEKEKSEAEREKAEAEAGEFNGIELFSRPGTAFLVGQLLDDHAEDNTVDELAQQFITKLKMDDEGFQKFKSDSGPLLKLQGFQQLLNRMEEIIRTSTDDDVENATDNA